MTFGVAGATWATQNCIEGLRRNGFTPVVFGQRESDTIAGWTDLEPDHWFDNINEDPAMFKGLEALFVVGLSQMVKTEVLNTPRLGCVGFHPTLLPQGRGRAPIAWLILGACKGAATFFKMDEGMDSGPIFVQVPFSVGDNDYASDVCDRISFAMDVALDDWLPRSMSWESRSQDEAKATYLGVRRPEDSKINWMWDANYIERLVRASSDPHPGAWSGEHKIWRASVIQMPYYGVPGRVLGFDGGAPFVQTGLGLLRIDEYEGSQLKVGHKL